MINFTRLCALFLCLSFTANVFSQDSSAVHISYDYKRANDSEIIFNIHSEINSGTKLFALQHSPTDVLYSTIQFDSSLKKLLRDSITYKGHQQKAMDPILQSEVHYFIDSVEWQQKISASPSDSFLMKGKVSYMVQKGGDYLPGEKEFKIFVLPQADTNNISVSNNDAQLQDAKTGGSVATRSLNWIFFTAFAGGLLALITPCVYSMIPVTVSFFTKRSRNKAEGIKNAILYSTSIVIIFTLLGFLITVIFGPTALNNLATNWIANLIFFGLFLLFGISFLGAFEISLPSSWGNKADNKAGSGSFIGIFFMALTLVNNYTGFNKII